MRVFAGMVLGFVVFGLLLAGAFALRITPEVVNCDRGRQSVEVRVANASLDRDTRIVRREVRGCRLWFHDDR